MNIHKQSASIGIGTKSQQALQLQREEHKLERKAVRREQKKRSIGAGKAPMFHLSR